MAGKYYAVKEGLSRGIFLTWEECKASVSGYSGAVYKSFKTRQEAEAFLGIGQADVCKTEDCVKIYVDGSYNSAARNFPMAWWFFQKRGGNLQPKI